MTPDEFWMWFRLNADRIAASPNDPDLIRSLDQRVSSTWPDLAWEIGPDPSGDWYLAISPNLNRALATSAKEAVKLAPSIKGWRVYPVRQRKFWDGKFDFETQGRVLHFDASEWRYVLLRYPGGDLEVVLVASEASPLSFDERWQAAAVVLEGLLGEACMLENIDDFALEPALDGSLSDKEKSLRFLPGAFGLK